MILLVLWIIWKSRHLGSPITNLIILYYTLNILIFYFIFLFYKQMHHPIQMKPADSENRNGII